MESSKLGLSGTIAQIFQNSAVTPLIGIIILLAGILAVFITPKEEEPQINVTIADIIIYFPGASAKNVEQMVSFPTEKILSQIADLEHITSRSEQGISIITVQFKVGIKKTEALVRLYDTINSHADWLPQKLGVSAPIIKSKSIDDVPILSLTLYFKDRNFETSELYQLYELEKIANNIEIELKRIKGTKEVTTIGGPGRTIKIEVDPQQLALSGITIQDISNALNTVNIHMPIGNLLIDHRAIIIKAGKFLNNITEIENLIVGIRSGTAIYMKDITKITEGPIQTKRLTAHVYKDPTKNQFITHPAITMAITKKQGENAVAITKRIKNHILQLQKNLIPKDINVEITRNYGYTANEKTNQLIHKLLFATTAVIALIFITIGKKESIIVGTAVILTLAATLFVAMLSGFTINRVSLFSLIFSIGILVDDAIVVVENIHRRQKLEPKKDLITIIPIAVNEVGRPTILATLTVIASLLPMLFVSGLMGPYMSPIPINASLGMIISLIVAFTITPWMFCKLLKHRDQTSMLKLNNLKNLKISNYLLKISSKFNLFLTMFFDESNGRKNRLKLIFTLIIAMILAISLPIVKLVIFKMLPFDNKSEFQIMVDLPVGTRVEKTFEVLEEIGRELYTMSELKNYQIYAGTTAPISFNGLVRQYYLRQDSSTGDLQVNLVDKKYRINKSHHIVTKLRPLLTPIAKKYLANIKVIEVPPGPPVLSPIVAEIYGHKDQDRLLVAKQIRNVFQNIKGIVDLDDSSIAKTCEKLLIIDNNKARLMGISNYNIINTLKAGLSGENIIYIHDASKNPAAISIRLPEKQQDSLSQLLKLTLRNIHRDLITLDQLVDIIDCEREQSVYHKDLLPVNYVVADLAGKIDSPLYGLFEANSKIKTLRDPYGNIIKKYFINQPSDPNTAIAVKWDGEWQVTYDTFRDLILAFIVGLILIYLLLSAEFNSYLTPIIIMLPIPLTFIGVMPGHALLKSEFTATSMIGVIALAGIIVRNSILLVDFTNLQIKEKVTTKLAIINAVKIRAKPIILTGLSAILGAFFILNDPIFNGLAISLIFGIFVATLLTLIVIPVFYFSLTSFKAKYDL